MENIYTNFRCAIDDSILSKQPINSLLQNYRKFIVKIPKRMRIRMTRGGLRYPPHR